MSFFYVFNAAAAFIKILSAKENCKAIGATGLVFPEK